MLGVGAPDRHAAAVATEVTPADVVHEDDQQVRAPAARARSRKPSSRARGRGHLVLVDELGLAVVGQRVVGEAMGSNSVAVTARDVRPCR